MRKIYNKLVRDRIPEIIEKDGKTAITSRLSLGEYQMALDAKLGEEVKEYAESLDIHGHLDRPRYLCAYDMGQKIKLDSIGRSLQLIKQGGSGPAAELLSYLIGEEEIPNLSGLENFDVTALRKDKALGSYLHGFYNF